MSNLCRGKYVNIANIYSSTMHPRILTCKCVKLPSSAIPRSLMIVIQLAL